MDLMRGLKCDGQRLGGGSKFNGAQGSDQHARQLRQTRALDETARASIALSAQADLGQSDLSDSGVTATMTVLSPALLALTADSKTSTMYSIPSTIIPALLPKTRHCWIHLASASENNALFSEVLH